MSNINTNNIDASYPVPGVNNNSQGFRDNFTGIKQNLGIAGTEITELQQKAVLKSAIAGQTLDNDLRGTAISNATVQGFRTSISTVQQGDINGSTVTISANRADIQVLDVGNLNFANSSTVTLQFRQWPAPSGTQGNLQLVIVGAGNTNISFANSNVDSSRITLENFDASNNSIRSGADTSTGQAQTPLVLNFSTNDCGNTISVDPVNRSRRASQVVYRTPTFLGQPGDGIGSIAIDQNTLWICTRNYDGINQIWESVGAGGGGSGTAIVNGSSNVSVAGNANITAAVAGTTVLDIGNTATALTGSLSVSGGSISATAATITTNATVANTATIGNLTVTGLITANNITINATNTVGFAANLSVTGDVSAASVSAADITSNGTANITGNANFSGNNVSLGAVGNLKITGGSANQFLRTDGAGNLSWAAAGSGGSSIDNGTSSVTVIASGGNVRTNVGGAAITTVSSDGLAVTGNANVTANITAGNIYANSGMLQANTIVATNSIMVTNNITVSTITANSSADITNLRVTGLFRAPDSILSVGGIAATGDISTSGNLSAANLIVPQLNLQQLSVTNTVTAGRLTANSANIAGNTQLSALAVTGSITSNSLTVNAGIIGSGTINFVSSPNVQLGPIGNLIITGGANGQVLTTNGSGGLSWTTVSGGGGGGGTAIINGTSNVNISAPNANVTVGVDGVNSVLTVNANGIAVRGIATTTGNLSVGGNITAPNGSIYANSGVIGALTATIVGDITANNTSISNTVTAATINVSGAITAANVTASGNITGNVINAGNITVTANITAANITVGNITTTGTTAITLQSSANFTISPGGSGALVVTGGSGNIIAANSVNATTVNVTSASVANTTTTANLTVTGTANITTGNISTGNISTLTSANANVTTLAVTGTATIGSLLVNSNANITGNVIGQLRTTTSPPANINSAGTVGQLAVGSRGGQYYLYVCVAPNTWRGEILNTF